MWVEYSQAPALTPLLVNTLQRIFVTVQAEQPSPDDGSLHQEGDEGGHEGAGRGKGRWQRWGAPQYPLYHMMCRGQLCPVSDHERRGSVTCSRNQGVCEEKWYKLDYLSVPNTFPTIAYQVW